MGKEKLTKEKMIQLNVALIGIPRINIPGIMQCEDRSDGYSLTLKLMTIVEKASVDQKAWEQINKTTPIIDKGDLEADSKNKKRDKKLNDFLQEATSVVFNKDEMISYKDLDNLWHPEDAKKSASEVEKDGRKRFTPQTIINLQPVLEK